MKIKEIKNGNQTLQYPVIEEDDFTKLSVKTMDLVMELEQDPENAIVGYQLIRALIKTFLPKAESAKWDNLTFEDFAKLIEQGNADTDLPKD